MTWETDYCDKAIAPDCTGHQGWEKVPSCLVDALRMEPDAQTGTVDWDVWAGLIIQDKAETFDGVNIPAGTYMVITENDQGHVRWEQYPTAQAAQDAFDLIDNAYGDYLHARECREYAIVSSTGRTGQ